MSKEIANAAYMDADNEVLSIYLEQINKIPMLSYEEEYELALKAKNGDKKAFVSGDGGYYTHFQRIGEAFGGFDVACLESGQYNKAWRFSHSFPHEIVKEALDLQTKMVLPIHWGRFVSGSHDWNGVIKYLYPEFIARKIPCVIPMIGEIYHIGSMPSSENWWDIE